MGSMPDALTRAGATSMSGTRKVTWCGPRAAGGQEAAGDGRAGTPGGGQQPGFRARGEFQPPPPEPGRGAATRPGSARQAAEQLPAAGKGARADGEVIEDSGHGITRYGQQPPVPNAGERAGPTDPARDDSDARTAVPIPRSARPGATPTATAADQN